jgi:hypothetical protein
MTTPTGAIKFSDITTEFGTPTGNNLGAFRVSQTIIGQSWPLDTGVPTSGAISFSQLQGKTLNVVIDSGTTGGDEFNVTLTSYFPSKATAVGGFYTLPGALSTLGGKKYYVYLRKDYGGSASVTTSVKSGAWPTGSTLNVVVSNNATIWGRGGNGGGGANGGAGTYGGGGGTGLNSIGFSYSANLTISSGSRIIAGFGGGGGGGGGYSNPDPGPYDPSFGGGGGGGGQGNPGGAGGSAGIVGNPGLSGYAGYVGSKTSGGNGNSQGCFPSINGSGGGGGGGGGITFGYGVGCGGGGWVSGSNGSVTSGGRGGNPWGAGGGGNGTAIIQNGATVTVSNGGYCYPSATPVTASFT